MCGAHDCRNCFPGCAPIEEDEALSIVSAERDDALADVQRLTDLIMGDNAPMSPARLDAAMARAGLMFATAGPRHFGERLTAARRGAGMGVRQLAAALHVSHVAVLGYERGAFLPLHSHVLAQLDILFPGLWRGTLERVIHKASRLRRQIALLEGAPLPTRAADADADVPDWWAL